MRPRQVQVVAAAVTLVLVGGWLMPSLAGVPLPSLHLAALLLGPPAGPRASAEAVSVAAAATAAAAAAAAAGAADVTGGLDYMCPRAYDPLDFDDAATALDAYAVYHKCALGRARTQYLVHEAVDGLGNRLLGLASSYLYAVLTGRVLLVAWPAEPGSVHAPLADLLEAPGFAWDGDAVEVMTTGAVYRGWAAVLDRAAWAWDPALGCRDLRADARPVVWMRSNQYYAPLLLHHRRWAAWLARVGLADGYMAQIAPRLFRPAARVRARVNAWWQAAGPVSIAIGVHVRTFDYAASLLLLPRVTAEAARLAGTLINDTTTVSPTHMPSLVVVASDVPSSAAQVVAGLPSTLVARRTSSAVMVGRTSAADVEDALTELFILGRCARVVATAGSTFGMLAQALTGRPGVTVVSAHESVALNSTEPCYQSMPARYGPLPCGVRLVSQDRRCESCCRGPPRPAR
jgi:hypothetical protein